MGFNKIWWNKT